ncbi:rhodanese-like domain-containing protein [Ferrimonas lipolytica]|uniref:Rhodanese-like domain-containing protein n=1 Tax=Ferrimonas lipolytica TaxID=2724191 RepID=A0A6H1UCD6_9GAMM|nr:rhodanese-like domain-containing protein [Ferrimonas lipolytica]QIZ75472.1 rhodanese-like domain-containing protein [Ferrimonas lipolytica]
MRTLIAILFTCLSILPVSALAGSGDDMAPAQAYRLTLDFITMQEAESLVGQEGVYFYDVNTLELWAEGFIPGAVHFFVEDWKSLLPEDKDAHLIFYCANRLCNASEIAAYSVMKLGYTHVRQMPDGIFGWRMSGRPTEQP